MNPLNDKQQANLQAIQQQAGSFAKLLPTEAQIRTFMESLLVYLSGKPELLLATPQSLLQACYKAAMTGIRPGHGGDIVVYNEKLPSGATVARAQFQAGVAAKVEIAMAHGLMRSMGSQAVCERDEFEWDAVTSCVTRHVFDWRADRGEVIASYAWAVLPNGEKVYEFCSPARLRKIKALSKSSIKTEWPEEFARKCAENQIFQRRRVGINNPEMTTEARKQLASAAYSHLLPTRVAPALPEEPTYTEADPARSLTHATPDDVPVYDVTPETIHPETEEF